MNDPLKIEQKFAQRIVAKYSLKPPVDVSRILRLYADCEEDLLPYNVDAVCINRKDRPLVIINLMQSHNRMRFTLAHELGHLIIPWHIGMISCHTDNNHLDVGELTSYNNMEMEANTFAAELLMPSWWLSQVVIECKDRNLTYILEYISTTAEVSIYAALNSVFKFLPPGYIGYIKERDKDYGKRLVSPGTNVYMPYKNGELDKDWLNNCSNKSDCIEMDLYKIWWWKFDEIISEPWLSAVLEHLEKQGLSFVLDIIAKRSKESLALSILPLIELLPSGYVIIIKREDDVRIFQSRGTYVRIPTIRETDDMKPLYDNSTVNGSFKYLDYTIYWWKFTVVVPQQDSISDSRPSIEIIRDIIDQLNLDKKRLLPKVNGIIGSLNSRVAANVSINEFYKLLRQRFIGRVELEDLIAHPDFETFLMKKSIELIEKCKS